MTSTERNRVCLTAKSDWRRAYDQAAAIADAWFRAQARACVARSAPSADVLRIARESLTDANSASDSYRRVAGTAWPIRALIERGYTADAASAIAAAVQNAEDIDNPVNRVDALFLVWQAVYPLGADARNHVLTPLLHTALAADSWRPQRVLQSLVFMLPPTDRALADRIIQSMPPGKYKRTTARRLAAGERQEPRAFFWDHAA